MRAKYIFYQKLNPFLNHLLYSLVFEDFILKCNEFGTLEAYKDNCLCKVRKCLFKSNCLTFEFSCSLAILVLCAILVQRDIKKIKKPKNASVHERGL